MKTNAELQLPTLNQTGPQLLESISVIFPAFNEQENVRDTVNNAREVLPRIAKTWEIIVVNDGSCDSTTQICSELTAQFPEVSAIHHPVNRGYGAALKSGILAAKHSLIFFSDSDGQFNLQELQKLASWSKDYDIVAGYRKKRRDPFHRLVNAWGWNILVHTLLKLHIRDIDCAFKLFHREVFDQVQIRSVGAMVNTEILAQAVRFGMSIHEVEVSHFPRANGAPTGAKLSVILKAFRELYQLWWKLRKIAPDQRGLFCANDNVPQRTRECA